MNWGAYTQDANFEQVDKLGAELSIKLHCGVHYPAYNKNLFECECGVIFPLYMVKGHGWDAIIKKHEDKRELSRR